MHFVRLADGDAKPIAHGREFASDNDFLVVESLDHRGDITADVDHEKIGVRRNYAIAGFRKFRSDEVARSVEAFFVGGNDFAVGEAGDGGGKDGGVAVVEENLAMHGFDGFFLRDGIAEAHASHSVNFRECTRDDEIGVLRNHVDDAGVARVFDEVEIRFVDEDVCGGRNFGEKIGEFVARVDCGGRVVGIADVDEAYTA